MLDVVPMRPVMTQPMRLVTLKTWVTESGSINLSCTFFCVATTEQVAPRIATLVNPGARVAFKAYSANSSSKEGEVSCCVHSRCAAWQSAHTDLIQASLWREHCNVAIISSSCTTAHGGNKKKKRRGVGVVSQACCNDGQREGRGCGSVFQRRL